MPIEIAVSVITMKKPELLFGCLDSFLKYAPAGYNFKISVVVNAPGTDVPQRLRARYDTNGWNIIENQVGLGFAANHNMVIRDSAADYVLILNDDLIFLPGSIEKMIAFMERPDNRNVAMLLPRLLNTDHTMQPCTYSFPNLPRAVLSVTGLRGLIPFSGFMNILAGQLGMGGGKSRFWAHDKTVDVDTFRGACVLGRMEAVRQIGLMHTESSAGGEEIEWHFRFKKAGWRIVFYHEAEVVHYGSQTTGMNPVYRNEALKSYLYFFRHHKPGWQLYAFSLVTASALIAQFFWHGITLRPRLSANDAAGLAVILKKV